MQEGEGVTQYVRRLYISHKNKYGYTAEEVARRAFVHRTTVYRVIFQTDDHVLEKWDSILNILFAVGVDQVELRHLNKLYRNAVRSGIPVVRRQGSTSSVTQACIDVETQPFRYSPEAIRILEE